MEFAPCQIKSHFKDPDVRSGINNINYKSSVLNIV